MSNLIDIMRTADFNCERIAGLLMYEEAKNGLEIAPILKAAMLGLLSKVKNLLAEGANANIRYGRDGTSVLGASALMGHLAVMRALLEHGVDPNAADSSGETVLHTAAMYGRANPDLIDLLLSAGADIEARTPEGTTPLHHAASRPESGGAAAILLQRGSAEGALNSEGHSPFHYAAECGHLLAIRALGAAGADVNLRSTGSVKVTPLDIAASYGKPEVVRELARHGADLDAAPDDSGLTALHHAASLDEAGAVEALLESGASVTAQTTVDGDTPLNSAAQGPALEAMRMLLRHGAPVRPSQDDRMRRSVEPPLHAAARKGGMQGAAEAVDLLLRWGADEADLNMYGETAAEVVDDGLSDVEDWPFVPADPDLVHKLLASAPADRAWRRRGLLLLCLARKRPARRRNSGVAGKRKGEGKGKGALAKGSGGGGGGRGSPEHGDGGDLTGVVESLMGFEEEGFFRTIVRYL